MTNKYLTLGRTRKFTTPAWCKREGGGGVVGGGGWLDHLLFMTSLLVTIADDHQLTCLKVYERDERTATQNVRC